MIDLDAHAGNFSKDAQSVLSSMEKFIDYFSTAKKQRPKIVRISKPQSEKIMKSLKRIKDDNFKKKVEGCEEWRFKGIPVAVGSQFMDS